MLLKGEVGGSNLTNNLIMELVRTHNGGVGVGALQRCELGSTDGWFRRTGCYILYPGKEELPDDKEMTIFDHLEELRERIFVSVLAVGAAVTGCFTFSKYLIVFLEAPVKNQGVRFLQLAS
ncbi:hypothetical protein Rs2_15684 [Raphanus sativus]|nr:hypothetical protein Rs2_15684 [Raphanus sativus]